MTVQFEITKKDVLLQVKTEAFVTGEANKDGELSRINHATKTQASDDDDDILQYGSISYYRFAVRPSFAITACRSKRKVYLHMPNA